MRSLEETIKATKMCWIGPIECSKCAYKDIASNGNCCAARANDALQYLQEYKELTAELVERNEPLTWDELQTMEGKPVWIDSVPLVRRWVIIKKFHPIGGNKNLFDMEVEDGAHFLRKSMGRDTGAWWQAYRKERK